MADSAKLSYYRMNEEKKWKIDLIKEIIDIKSEVVTCLGLTMKKWKLFCITSVLTRMP